MMHKLRKLMIVAAACAVLVVPAAAQTLQKLPPRGGSDIPILLPGAEPGQMVTRTQLVWDAEQMRMQRVTFQVWDPLPSRGLDFRWDPETGNTDGLRAVTGPGRLTWREAGRPTYDQTAIVSTYQGTFAAGRLSGQGRMMDRSGLAYTGAWSEGRMHGAGELSLPNGDVYIGGFAQGRLHGQGTYIDASGEIYRGGYADNLRQGPGTMTERDGAIIAAVWQGGKMVAGSRNQIAPAPRDADFRSYSEFSLGVVVDRRVVRPMTNMDQPLHYTSQNTAERMHILPDYPRMLEIWRGEGTLNITSGEGYQIGNARRVDDVHSFIGLGPSRVEPVPIILEFENRTPADVQITSAYLDVADSETDQDPAVQLLIKREDCHYSDTLQTGLCVTDFVFENYGWSNPQNATLNFTFDGQNWFRQSLGTWEHTTGTNFEAELRQLGVNFDAFKRRIVCPNSGIYGLDRPDQCRNQLRNDPDFGRLATYVELSGGTVGVMVRGTLDYDWRTAKGEWRRKSSPFDGYIEIAALPGGPEMGEGGNPEPIGHDPFKLRLDVGPYRLQLPLFATVGSGVNGRWRLELEADKSSNHDFRVVFVLADGKRVASRPISMLYAKPRTFPAR